jgi:hypothetical protein
LKFELGHLAGRSEAAVNGEGVTGTHIEVAFWNTYYIIKSTVIYFL